MTHIVPETTILIIILLNSCYPNWGKVVSNSQQFFSLEQPTDVLKMSHLQKLSHLNKRLLRDHLRLVYDTLLVTTVLDGVTSLLKHLLLQPHQPFNC